jgi:hypothetical protein
MKKETTEERWLRWDTLIAKKDYCTVVQEFDKLLASKKVVLGDLVRRDEALELMGVVSLSPNAMFKRKEKNGKK